MRVFTSLAEVPASLPRSVVAVGKFDAVHLGHRRILRHLRTIARERSLDAVVFTFSNNPLSIVKPEVCPLPLLSPQQKLDLIAEQDIDTTVMVPFDAELAAQSPEEFVGRILCDRLHVSHVLVGADFRFGRHGAGTVGVLTDLGERLGFTVEVVEDVVAATDQKVSATLIRESLGRGEVARAATLLGRAHRVRGPVVHGAQRGRELGFPTANLGPDAEGLVPDDGVYAGWLMTEGERFPAAISVGTNPTFDDVVVRQVEVYVIDRAIDLYDRVVEVEFVDRLRGMVAFDSREALIAQMTDDVAQTRRLLGVGRR
ncbi:bifunctional riboflavin kinase/FAD synthetase [Klugiella xanthotipulae]|uniref:Riboflavin biosynthesis protein n=1 Tax=Klugiella xanthotipulae TaxID=244735 RepID=A0A543I4I0_9MICO|nr:bifunctional riboflavin kinase/FAD synthetase [Klugiella xanthotipulae]TQM65508.1 riboflavin kinase/FMN adenylyltransferase [Klugiella xanthotipulae]